jgi:MFS family permease
VLLTLDVGVFLLLVAGWGIRSVGVERKKWAGYSANPKGQAVAWPPRRKMLKVNRTLPGVPTAPKSKFTRLAITHALMMAGDAAMVVALADSFFFSVELDAARTQVLLFLAISFAPFLVVAPLIGPLIDRVAGGRRFVIALVAALRFALLLLMALYVDTVALFPLVFGSLVLQKTYAVSKSALVPSTVRSETELVEANSKLGLVSGLTGMVAVVPAAVLLTTIGSPAAIVYGSLLFAGAFASALRLAPEVVAATAADDEEVVELQSPSLRLGSIAMTVLRANVGFTFFHLAFWLRSFDDGTLLFGAAIGVSALATLLGNAVAPRVRRMMREETMLSAALIISAVGGIGLAALGSPLAGVALAGVVNFVAALGRLAFESIVQRDAPEANQGRAFATFETRFQFAWAAAAFIAVALQLPGAIGLLVVGVVAAAALVQLQIRDRQPAPRRPPARSKRGSSVSRKRSRPRGGRRKGGSRRQAGNANGARRSKTDGQRSGKQQPPKARPRQRRPDDITPPTGFRRSPGPPGPATGPGPQSRSESEPPRDH